MSEYLVRICAFSSCTSSLIMFPHTYTYARVVQNVHCELALNILNIAPKSELYGSTVNESYDSVDDLACCEWHFPYLAMPFERGPEGRDQD